MKYVFVDVESDGPCPGLFSMVCFGAVIFDKELKEHHTFYGKTAPISDKYYPDSLAISGFTRAQHEGFDNPLIVMQEFENWLNEYAGDKPKFISDCLTGDWAFISYYFHKYIGSNPFGYSGRRLSDLICGMDWNMRAKWKQNKSSERIHDPVFDAIENAKIFSKLVEKGLKL